MNKKIENFLNEAVTKNVFPGCCCAIINQNMVDYYCIGNKAIDPNIEENQIDTYYDLASLTKVVGTTPLILRMIQSGVIQYNTEVYKIIPKFKNKDITIFHLLTHNSGLPADLKWNLDVSKERMIEDICDASQQAIPGKKVIYSDLGYILLGYIAEVVSGEKLEDIMRKEVFNPLNMMNTMYKPSKDKFKQCAPTELSPHFHCLLRAEVHDRKAHLMNGVAGHAGLFSNIYDITNYAYMILNLGQYNGKMFLKKEYIYNMFTNYSLKNDVPRGIGFLTYTDNSIFSSLNSKKTIAHTGFTGTSILIDLDNQIGIVLLSNRVHPSRENTLIYEWRKEFHDLVMKTYKMK